MRFNSIEQAADNSLLSSEYLHPLVAEAAVEARKLKAEEAIDPKLFTDVYGANAVERDLRYVREMKKLFDKETTVQKQWADVFEAVFYQHAELSNWLGDDAHTIMASEYDDIKNGMDVAVGGPGARNFSGMTAARGTRGGNFGGGATGQIVSIDSTSITLSIPGGSGSRNVFYTAATPVMKSVTGTASDLKVGETVSVNGTANSDGSVTAQSIQLRPAPVGGAPKN
jgi:hypothetical protein